MEPAPGAMNVGTAGQPYAITLSGGVSLGSYMAGVSWATIELMRRPATGDNPDLLGVTGASAGGINAVLAAMRWCEDDARLDRWLESQGDRASAPADQRNLFAHAWLDVDLEDLLPRSTLDYANLMSWQVGIDPDGLLSRKKAYGQVRADVEERLLAPIYRAGCSLKLGLTVTRIEPRRLTVSGINTWNQRFVIPLEVSTDTECGLRFAVDVAAASAGRMDLLGNLLFLSPTGSAGARSTSSGPHNCRSKDSTSASDLVVDPKVVIGAALASSAFPVALGPVELRHCVPERQCGGRVDPWDSEHCKNVKSALPGQGDEPMVSCAESFVDGGVFDNVPLGVTMAQIESSNRLSKSSLQPLRYIYVAYGNRRKSRGIGSEWQDDENRGPLRASLAALGNFLTTATNYELHNVLRDNAWSQAGAVPLALRAAEKIDPGSRVAAATECSLPTPTHGRDHLKQGFELAVRGLRPGPDGNFAFELRSGAAALSRAVRDTAFCIEKWTLLPQTVSHDGEPDGLANLRDELLDTIERACTPKSEKTKKGDQGIELCGGTDEGRPIAAEARALSEDPRERELVVTTRLSPVAGTHALHFAALFDRPLREYDFYAGIYDALWSHADTACRVEKRKKAIRSPAPDLNSEQLPAAQGYASPGDDSDVRSSITGPDDECLAREFNGARKRVGLPASAGVGGAIVDNLFRVERAHRIGARMPAMKETDGAFLVMRALLAGRRCSRGDRTVRGVCMADGPFSTFAAELARLGFVPRSRFMKWALAHPNDDEWWLLPASYATSRLSRLTRDEESPKLKFLATAARIHIESGIDDVDDASIVFPSSLPDWEGRGWGAFCPFLTFSPHSSRHVELGLAHGGVRLDRLDLLAQASWRMQVDPPEDDDDDVGYGLFTRGNTVLTASLAPTYRLRGLFFSSLGVRGGMAVPVLPLSSDREWKEEINFELVSTFLDNKLRLAIGCHPWEATPNDGCWRHPYYSVGLNDLLGISYLAGFSPFHRRRFFLPFFAPRFYMSESPQPTRDLSAELGLLRGGWGDTFGLELDLSVIGPVAAISSDKAPWTFDASASLRIRFSSPLVRTFGARLSIPTNRQVDVRYRDVSAELFVVTVGGFRLASGWFPDPLEREDATSLPPWYLSFGHDFDEGPAADIW